MQRAPADNGKNALLEDAMHAIIRHRGFLLTWNLLYQDQAKHSVTFRNSLASTQTRRDAANTIYRTGDSSKHSKDWMYPRTGTGSRAWHTGPVRLSNWEQKPCWGAHN